VVNRVLILNFNVIFICHGFILLLKVAVWLIIATFPLLELCCNVLGEIGVNNQAHLASLGVDLEVMLGIQKLLSAFLG
jgi:hypothetical protein